MKLKEQPTNSPQIITDILFAVLINVQREFPFTQKINSRALPIVITDTAFQIGDELKD